MQNKKTFLILSLIFLILIGSLAIFIYATKVKTSISAQSLVKNSQINQKTFEPNKPIDEKLQKIKEEMNNIKKQTIVIPSDSEKTIIQEISTMKGVIFEKGSSFLMVGFSKGSEHWTSKVNLDTNSSIKISTVGKNLKTGSLLDLKIGDRIWVNALTLNMNAPELKASSIYLLNQ